MTGEMAEYYKNLWRWWWRVAVNGLLYIPKLTC
jgi:hypothetical protein